MAGLAFCLRCDVRAHRSGSGFLFCSKCGRKLREDGAGDNEVALLPRKPDDKFSHFMNYSISGTWRHTDPVRAKEHSIKVAREKLRDPIFCASCQTAIKLRDEGAWFTWSCPRCGGIVPGSFWEDKPAPVLPNFSACACGEQLREDEQFEQWHCPKCETHITSDGWTVSPEEFEPEKRVCTECSTDFWAFSFTERKCEVCSQIKELEIVPVEKTFWQKWHLFFIAVGVFSAVVGSAVAVMVIALGGFS